MSETETSNDLEVESEKKHQRIKNVNFSEMKYFTERVNNLHGLLSNREYGHFDYELKKLLEDYIDHIYIGPIIKRIYNMVKDDPNDRNNVLLKLYDASLGLAN